ncbi:MAG: FAD-dependent oxidoreductase [Armatimonadetes bacterium]|nr:FAD-dependent oxidoreductase [Armatimonadota bacterium]
MIRPPERRLATALTCFCLLLVGRAAHPESFRDRRLRVTAPRAAPEAQPRRSQGRVPLRPRRIPEAQPVLDIEKLRVVDASPFPNDIPTCDVLVVGGGLGGVAATEALARQQLSVILVEPTSRLGGQLTAQGVAVPDENRTIEMTPGTGTRAYRALREAVRAWYRALPGIKPGRERNVGQCWVSRISGEPSVWEQAIWERLNALRSAAGLRDVLLRNQLVSVKRFPRRDQYHYADFVNLDTGRVTRVAAHYLLDATEMGDGIALAGLPWTVGAEARSEYNEPHAPEVAHPEWIQSFTCGFVVRWQPDPPYSIVEKPEEYDCFRSLGEYTLAYDYADRGRVDYKMFARAPGAGGPFWTYRRLVAAVSFRDNPRYRSDIVLINWRGNDFREENPIAKPLAEQIRILQRAKAFAQGFLYWLQTECPRDEGGAGYPEIQMAPDVLDSEDGFAIHPYIRESRRLLAEFTLTENHMAPDPNQPQRKTGEKFFDRVGIAHYAIDIHPAQGEPPLLSPTLPYYLPLGSFIARGGAFNVLPAAKNFGATRLALSSARVHPTEWLAGEVAGHLAAFCIQRQVAPRTVRTTPDLLAAFQAQLQEAGIPIDWEGIIK